MTLSTKHCVKLEDKSYHSRECLNRECDSCGVEKLDLLKEEDVSLQAPKVSWQKFEYVAVGHTQEEKEKRKLQLVRKETSPGAMFNNFKSCCMRFRPTSFVQAGKASK